MASTPHKKTPRVAKSAHMATGAIEPAKALEALAPKQRAARRAKSPEASTTLQGDLFAVLKNSLRIEVSEGGFTDPNQRTVRLLFAGKCISTASFDVKPRREYEG